MNTTLYVVMLLATTASQSSERTSQHDWKLVRSVPNEPGGTLDFVVIPEHRQRDRVYYAQISNQICETRNACMVHFWTDLAHVPTSASMAGSSLAQMTAQYERSPSYKAPVLRMGCWLYATKAEGEADRCFYLPGMRLPWP